MVVLVLPLIPRDFHAFGGLAAAEGIHLGPSGEEEGHERGLAPLRRAVERGVPSALSLRVSPAFEEKADDRLKALGIEASVGVQAVLPRHRRPGEGIGERGPVPAVKGVGVGPLLE